VFETPPVTGRLELTGQAVLDLWLTLAAPDAHVAARLEVLDADGSPVPGALTYGLRSAQHLEPFTDGRFTQRTAVPAPVGTPVLVPVRFQPTDLVVPPGGRLRLTVAGSLIVNPGLSQLGVPEAIFHGPSQASGVVAPVTIHHDCAHPSVLRFNQPKNGATLPVAGDRPPTTQPSPGRRSVEVDGGGLTTAGYCTT
jgi:predicted acyl esterase